MSEKDQVMTNTMGSSPELRAGPQTSLEKLAELRRSSAASLRAVLGTATEWVQGDDKSRYQGLVNYGVNAGLLDFCIAQVGYGNNGVDTTAEAHVAGGGGYGDPVGAYHYVKPALDWKKNAENFANRVSGIGAGNLPMGAWADVEESGGLKKSELESWLYKFWNEAEQKIGEEVGCYTSAGYLNTALPLTNWLKNKPLWVASWTNGAAPLIPQEWAVAGRTWKLWQWKVYRPGSDYGVSSGGLDLNRYNGSRDQFNAEYGVTLPPEPEGCLQFEVVVRSLNVRSGPGTNYPVVGSLVNGEIVTPINIGGQEAWVEVEPGRWAAVKVGSVRFMEVIS